jgi:hypothetical protein
MNYKITFSNNLSEKVCVVCLADTFPGCGDSVNWRSTMYTHVCVKQCVC